MKKVLSTLLSLLMMLSLGTMNIAAEEGNESNASNTTTIKIPVSYTVVDETNSSDVVLEEDSPVEEVKSDVDVKTIVEDLTKDDSGVRSNLDPHQITAIKEGASTNIVLVVSDTNADEGEKTTVNNVIEQYSLKPAIMMDVDLLCTVTRNDIQVGDTQNITETKSEISVGVKVPDEYINTDGGINREYWVVRLHYSDTGLTSDVLPATFDSVTKMLTFKTNKFSLYAIAYKDTKVESEYVYIPSKNKKPVVNTAGYSFSPASIEISGNSAATVFNVDGLPESNVLDITYNTVLELKSANNETVSADVEFVDKITEDGSYTLNVKLQDTASKPALGKYEGNIIVTIKNNEYEAKIGDKLYATLNGAIADSKDGDTIVLLDNTSMTYKEGNSCISIQDKGITIDGNGKVITLSAENAVAKYGIYITGSDSLKTVTIKNATINTTNLERAIRTEGGIGFNIENSTITTNGVGVHVKGSNKVDIINTQITVDVIDDETFPAHLRTAVMVGGVDADVTVNGCTINAINESKTDSTLTWCKGLYVGSTTNAKLSVNDTKVVADYSIAIDGSGTEGSPTQIIVNSGEFSGIIGSPSGYSYKEMTINGGVFAGLDNFDSFYGKDNDIAKLVISGGTFNIKPDAKFITDGYEAIRVENIYQVVGDTAVVKTAAELQAILAAFTDAGSGDNVVVINEDIRLAEGETWNPAHVDGYNGAGVVTIEGNGHTIKGLNAPLLAGGFAGNSGIVIKDLTLENSNIDDTHADQGLGAFICSIDSMPRIELSNCRLKNSIITSASGARVGGLIGWSAGYNNPNDGPVDTYITITDCSVENTSITAKGSVGAIIGHAGNNPATFHTISGCTVTGTTLNSTDDGDWRVGVVVGTANVGEVTISGITESGNTLTQTGKTAPEHSNLYGRFVPGDTGKLMIGGVEITK